MDFISKLAQTMERFSFSHYGCTPLSTPLSLPLYKNWLQAGMHGEMEYLERHLPLKEDVSRWSPRARSAIVVAKNYLPHPYPNANSGSRQLKARTALYALGEDYHREFRAELENLAAALRLDFVRDEFLCFTDSAPVLERDLATRAGLGWIGKNTCLIHPQKGSLFFIGEILTSLDLTVNAPVVPDFCGTCDRCLRACPTGALTEPRVLDARKCISYWTIEARGTAPRELRERFGDWFFGCDICQTVCPWNEKVFGKSMLATTSSSETPIEDLRWILTSSNKTLSKAFATMPYSRARAMGLKRNALYVIGNLKLRELEEEVRTYLTHESLAELAGWTLERLERAGLAQS